MIKGVIWSGPVALNFRGGTHALVVAPWIGWARCSDCLLVVNWRGPFSPSFQVPSIIQSVFQRTSGGRPADFTGVSLAFVSGLAVLLPVVGAHRFVRADHGGAQTRVLRQDLDLVACQHR